MSQEKVTRGSLFSTYNLVWHCLDSNHHRYRVVVDEFVRDIFAEFATVRNMPWYNRAVVTIFGPDFSINSLTDLEEAALLYTIALCYPPGSHVLLFTL